VAATTISGPYPNFAHITCTLADTWYEVIVDSQAGKISLNPITNNARCGTEDSGGTALADADAYDATDKYGNIYTADNWTEISWSSGRGESRTSFCVSSSIAGTVVDVSVEF